MKANNALAVLFTSLILLIGILVTGCTKDDENTINNEDYHLTATVNGASFISAEDEMMAVHEDDYLIITGATQNDEEIITFQFFDFHGSTGTYAIGNGEFQTHCFYSNNEESFFVFDDDPQSSGTLEITSLTENSIKGSFSFKGVTINGEEVIQVTNGSFFVPIQEMP